MKDKYIFMVIGVLALGFGAYLWTQLEYYQEEVDAGWSLSAFLNPYLAAEQFLEEIEMEVESSYQLDLAQSLSSDATLFISNANDVLDERRADSLVSWMEAGGHIIIAAQVLYEGEEDVFLSRYEVQKYGEDVEVELFPDGDEPEAVEEEETLGDRLREANEILAEEERKTRDREQAQEDGRLNTVSGELIYEESLYETENIMTLRFESEESDIRVLVNGNRFLDHPSLYYGEDEEYDGNRPFYSGSAQAGTAFMQFYVEEGLLTVLADDSIWNNNNIGLFDHAFLLKILTENSNKVVFLRGAQVPSLLQLMWQYYKELCVTLAVLLVLWLVYRGRRFGPIIDMSDRGRRSFREHLSAVGDFYWRHKHSNNLLNNARGAVWRELNKKHFSARQQVDDDSKLSKLAELTDKAPSYLQNVMHGEAPQDEFKFYQLVKTLQNIRKQL